ncbi:MAG: hypothetical protein OEN01_16160, partial [Candidatus Krumholzibacteria bacterium]|nr:hypothetical protein [Candidatus Krumholzibacteria bacterium]
MFKQCVAVGVSLVALGASNVCAQDTTSTSAEPRGEPVATAVAAGAGAIKRAVFTSAVVDREPVDQLDSLNADTEKVFFFSEIVGMAGSTVTHRWIFGG